MPDNDVPEKRPSRFRQFGMRTLLFVMALAAIGAWLLRNEMVREERREKLIAELDSKGARWSFFRAKGPRSVSPPPSVWRQSIGGWLRGKPIVPPRAWATFPKGTTTEQFREFVDLFPDVRWVEIDGGDTTNEVLDLFASRGPYELFLIRNPVTVDEEFARKLARIKTANGVRLAAQEGSDAAMQNLANAGVTVEDYKCRNFWRAVGDDGFKATARLQNLNFMWLNCRGSDGGLLAFARHPSLMYLYVSGAGYSDASADVIPSLPKLANLRLSGTSHTDAGLAKAIAGCNANTFDFHNIAVGDQTIAALAKVPNFSSLNLDGIDLTAEHYDALALLPISNLRLKSDNLSDDHIRRLAPLASRLVSFTLDAPQVTDAGLTWLSGATQLKDLRLENTQATAATWSLITSSTTIGLVAMGGPNVDAQTLLAVSKMPTVAELMLHGSEVDDATLLLLPRSFGAVNLVNTRVTPDGLKRLAGMAGVMRVNAFADNKFPSLITSEDAAAIQSSTGGGVSVTFREAVSFECE